MRSLYSAFQTGILYFIYLCLLAATLRWLGKKR